MRRKKLSLQPSFLLVTQNIGSVEATVKGTDCSRRSKAVRIEKGEISEGSPPDASELSEATQDALKAMVADLRQWILFLSRQLFLQKSETTVGTFSSSGITKKEVDTGSSPCVVDVVVIHFQEIGGKWRNLAVNRVLDELLSRQLLPEAGWNSGLLMDDVEPKRFTALGTIIFVSKRLYSITSMLSVPHKTYVALQDDPRTYGGSVSKLFHSGRFQRARNSRKGYLLTSIRVGSMCVSFCNCHLYHDDLNTEAVDQTPSKYFGLRHEAFVELMKECNGVVKQSDPLFIFGDFNTRLDGKSLIEYVKEEYDMDVVPNPKSLMGPQSFWDLFLNQNRVKDIHTRFDLEPKLLMEAAEMECKVQLAELPVTFPPTFKVIALSEPLKKDYYISMKDYAHSRLPAWCDRVFLNPAALKLISRPILGKDHSHQKLPLYNSLSVPHTDHHGVYLGF